MRGAILILSGPSGAGKSSIINAASEKIGDFYFSISSTSRKPREGEVDGRDYHFVDKSEFDRGIEAGDFLEYAMVHGNYYGTSLKPVLEAVDAGRLVIFDIDVQGYHLAQEQMSDLITSAFILPPTLKELEQRLHNRCTDDATVIAQRVQNAKSEIAQIGSYDFVIVNDELEVATEQFIAVARAARLKISNTSRELFIKEWLTS
jgi:guanylate kinase